MDDKKKNTGRDREDRGKAVVDPDELDVYQAEWVIGKQRGRVAPLEAEKLVMLLEAGRLSWAVISSEEREVIESDESLGRRIAKIKEDVAEPKVTMEPGFDKEKLKVAEMMVKGLVTRLPEDFEGTIEKEEWKKMSHDEKMAVTERLFKLKYGSFPDFFVMDVYRFLGGGYA